MKCQYCSGKCHKADKQRNGTQKWKCLNCYKHQQQHYKRKAYRPETDDQIKRLLKEGLGIRSMARLLEISPNTVMSRSITISNVVEKPHSSLSKVYEMDELCTYIGNKSRRVWIAYAIRKDTREVVDFKVGRRNNKT